MKLMNSVLRNQVMRSTRPTRSTRSREPMENERMGRNGGGGCVESSLGWMVVEGWRLDGRLKITLSKIGRKEV
jgi:hypothetical protein